MRTSCLGAVLSIALVHAVPAGAQIPQDEYLRYLQLQYPTIVRQTEASERLHLYGDRAAPGYRDESPRDGIDDARGARLVQLLTRFAPIMVLNSSQFPIDFRTFYGRDAFPLSIDRWDISRHEYMLTGSTSVDMARLAGSPCPASPVDTNDDCRLVSVLDTFAPDRQPLDGEIAVPAERNEFPVLHFDMPGFDERTWKAEYGAPQYRQRYEQAARTFAHPFIAEVDAADGTPVGYELVIQYWFFYPVNDGPNNHEGDWEHINVVVSRLSELERSLDADGVQRLLSAATPLDGDDPLVIKRIEYYFHHYLTPIDFSSPNAYGDRADWTREAEAMAGSQGVSTAVLERIRRRAWRDEAETQINTRPIVWIGGDGIGVQNVLETPGLKDRDGHASYPFRGYYKRIGAASVSERVIEEFDHVEYFADPGRAWPAVEDYGDPGKIALTPDWERVLELSRRDPEVRRNWSWLVLPVRFGYPASPSPAAGIIPHADTGNGAVVGPSFNDGWNRTGDTPGYERYDLVQVSWARPLGATDSFFPRLGFFNAPIVYFMIKPPLDLAWRTLALPVRAVAGARQPTFFPASAPAVRSVTFETGLTAQKVHEDFSSLFFSRNLAEEMLVLVALNLAIQSGGSDFQNLQIIPRFDWVTTPAYSIVFNVSPRFSTESTVVNYRTTVGFDVTADGVASPIEVRGDFRQFEYHGALRYNLKTGNFKPYLKYGSGITWYRLKNVSVNDIRLPDPDSPRIKPAGSWLSLGFNELVLGGGIDWSGKVGPTWLGTHLGYSFIHHPLGIEREAAVENIDALATELAGRTFSVSRHQIRATVTVGF